MIKITILTPTFNRANTLPRLFESIKNQSIYNFEWLIIDDGSSDNTKRLVESYRKTSQFPVRYFYKDNGGKHSALNFGFDNALGTWVFIVDSDDWLPDNVCEKISQEISSMDNDVCLSLMKCFCSGESLSPRFKESWSSHIEAIEEGLTGDKVDIYKTSSLKEYRFPVFENEKFMAEGALHLNVAGRTGVRFRNYIGTYCEFQVDGLTANSLKNRYRNVNSTLYTYEQEYKFHEKYSLKSKAAINWWRFRFGLRDGYIQPRISRLYMLLGFFMYLLDRRKFV